VCVLVAFPWNGSHVYDSIAFAHDFDFDLFAENSLAELERVHSLGISKFCRLPVPQFHRRGSYFWLSGFLLMLAQKPATNRMLYA